MDVEPSFVADGKSSKRIEPGEAALDDPSVAAKLLAGLDAAPGDAGLDPAALASSAAATIVVGFVGVQLVRPAPWSAALAGDRHNRVKQIFERPAVVNVGCGQQESERDAAPVRDKVTLCARLAPIRRVRACRDTPFLAAIDELSRQARLQSMRSAWRKRRSNSRCKPSHTPAACQSRSRRQQVTPEPQPISIGSISHGMPVRSTNRMPVSAARCATMGRPPFGFAATGGSKGSTIDQRSSDTNSVRMPTRWEQTCPGARF